MQYAVMFHVIIIYCLAFDGKLTNDVSYLCPPMKPINSSIFSERVIYFTILATDFYDGLFSPKFSCTLTVDYVIICNRVQRNWATHSSKTVHCTITEIYFMVHYGRNLCGEQFQAHLEKA